MVAPDTLAFPPQCCPLCGANNNCAMVSTQQTGQGQPPCWCMSATFTLELLASVPLLAKGTACICQACAETALALATQDQKPL